MKPTRRGFLAGLLAAPVAAKAAKAVTPLKRRAIPPSILPASEFEDVPKGPVPGNYSGWTTPEVAPEGAKAELLLQSRHGRHHVYVSDLAIKCEREPMLKPKSLLFPDEADLAGVREYVPGLETGCIRAVTTPVSEQLSKRLLEIWDEGEAVKLWGWSIKGGESFVAEKVYLREIAMTRPGEGAFELEFIVPEPIKVNRGRRS